MTRTAVFQCPILSYTWRGPTITAAASSLHRLWFMFHYVSLGSWEKKLATSCKNCVMKLNYKTVSCSPWSKTARNIFPFEFSLFVLLVGWFYCLPDSPGCRTVGLSESVRGLVGSIDITDHCLSPSSAPPHHDGRGWQGLYSKSHSVTTHCCHCCLCSGVMACCLLALRTDWTNVLAGQGERERERWHSFLSVIPSAGQASKTANTVSQSACRTVYSKVLYTYCHYMIW